MREVMVLNGSGEHVSVKVDEATNFPISKDSINKDVSCLTCGSFGSDLHVRRVSHIEGFREWLQARQHYTQFEDSVVICPECEEMAIEYDNYDLAHD